MATRILIVDDHAVLRDALAVYLEREADLTVVGGVGCGRDAIQSARELAPDVILTELVLPDLDGVELIRRLIEERPEAVVLTLTQRATSEHVFRALRAGVSGYALKQRPGAELLAGIRSVRRGERYLAPPIAALLIDTIRLVPAEEMGASPLDRLSTREREVMLLVVQGYSSARVGEAIHLSPKTVETYRSRLMKKLGVRDLSALVRFAVEHELLPPP